MALSTRMKVNIKFLLWRLPPPLGRIVVGLLCRMRLLRATYRVYFRIGRPGRVLFGPFKNMNYLPVAVGSAWFPKLIGSYEKELHPTIERLCEGPCDVLVDVGSAEGYYAVGLTIRLKPEVTYCYDIDPEAHRVAMKIAALNSVKDRIVSRGFCTPKELESVFSAAEFPLLICDCEGGEDDLLQPDLAPTLRQARIVVEVHEDPSDDQLARQLQSRFAMTHDVEVIHATVRRREDLPSAFDLPDDEVAVVLDENRHRGTTWLVMMPTVTAHTPVAQGRARV